MTESQLLLPISAFVASCNEGHLLERCLNGLSFCAEIFVINLDSKDNTNEIAKKYGATILHYPRYPIVEEAHFHAVPNATQPWILLTDPDEVVGGALEKKIIDLFNSKEINQYNAVMVPVQFYFKTRALKGTIWGGPNSFRFLFLKKDIKLSKLVHQGVSLPNKSSILSLQRESQDLVLHHFWMTSYSSFLEKINRYIAKEGERMCENNIEYSFSKHFKESFSAFKNCYVSTKGYKDGFTGLILSFIWFYYTFGSWRSLYKYSKKP